MPRDVEYVISPPKGVLSLDWRELWRYRDLFLVLAWRDISVRYKQTVLGVVWALFQPVITMVIFTFIFNRVAKIESGDGTPYPVFLYVGLLLWQYFSNTLTHAADSMISNSALIQKVYFPRLIVPAATAITALVDFAIPAVLLAGLMAWYHVVPHVAGLAILPVLLLCAVMCAMGAGLFLAAINVKYRDVRYALPFMIQVVMYVTPVIYPVAMLDRHPVIKGLMLWCNPISGVITVARGSVLGAGTVQWDVLGISLLMSFVMFVAGLYYFRNTERYFADIV
jgi:lipopolysaccharide transport system permease protein